MNNAKLFFIGMLFLNVSFVFGQTKSDTILIKRNTFLQYNHRLTPKDLFEIAETNPDANKETQKAKWNHFFGVIFAYSGGALIGFPIGTALGGGDPIWAMAGVGVGLVLVAIPFSIAYNKHIKKAVRIYNNGLKKIGINKIDYNIGITRNGLGVKMRF